MLRGQHTLFNSLFIDDPKTMQELPPLRRGRSEELVRKRNTLLIHRYYYYVKIMGCQYLATLHTLEDELFIAQRTIVDAMNRNSAQLKALNAGKPTLKYFREKYPFMVWG